MKLTIDVENEWVDHLPAETFLERETARNTVRFNVQITK